MLGRFPRKVVFRQGLFKITRQLGRESPYTVWYGPEVIFFAKDLTEAGKAITRFYRELSHNTRT